MAVTRLMNVGRVDAASGLDETESEAGMFISKEEVSELAPFRWGIDDIKGSPMDEGLEE